MCLFNDAELNCVSTKILFNPEFKQLEIGISTNRYLPAIGTAGLERVAVRGDNLDPCPPPRITETTFDDIIFWKLTGYIIGYIEVQIDPKRNLRPSLIFLTHLIAFGF